MQSRSSLLASAALGVLLAAGMGASAQAAAKHHRAARVASDAEAKVDTLTATVSELEQRLNDETAARQAVEARAQQAEAKADAAEADAQALRGEVQSQIQTIPGEIQTAAAANKAKPTWADNTTVGMTVYTDLSNISQRPTPNKINGTGADIKRAYVSITHNFNSIYSANLTVDLAPNGLVLNGATFGSAGLQGSEAIKYAYIQAAYDPRFIVKFGAAQMPWIPFVEDTYGYRFVEKVPVDYNKVGNSSDWGVNVHGDFGKGLFDYSVSVVDGAGYKNPVRSQQMDVEGRVNLNYMGFIGALGGYSGQLSNDIQQAPPPLAKQTATRWDALVAYVNPTFRVGFEYFQATDWKVVTATTPDRQEGYSLWGAWNFYPQFSVFGRYDWGNPSEKLAPRASVQYFNIGINYEPVKTLDLALVYKHDQLDDGITAKGAVFSYSDGNTSLTPAHAGASANYDEIGLFTQFKF